MVGFSLTELIVSICISGFMFFASLPFANNCLDYLVRINIPDELQERVWGLVGFISQIRYIVAYSISGVAVDILGVVIGQGVGRGAAYVVLISGICLSVIALSIPLFGSIRKLENSDKSAKNQQTE